MADIGTGSLPQAGVCPSLTSEDYAAGFVRPMRHSYRHVGSNAHSGCGMVTTLNTAVAELLARHPRFYRTAYCVWCHLYRPVGATGDFVWESTRGETIPPDMQRVGT